MDKLTFAQLSAISILTLMPLLSGMGKELFDIIAEVRRHRKEREDKTNGR
jgi:hypothetical protein|nr:MAG TPA: hypothetical protein [Caudoviricetes sp.]